MLEDLRHTTYNVDLEINHIKINMMFNLVVRELIKLETYERLRTVEIDLVDTYFYPRHWTEFEGLDM